MRSRSSLPPRAISRSRITSEGEFRMNPAAISDLSALPLVLTINEIAAIYRISLSTIRKGVQAGTFLPRPWDRYPYRWRREDVQADLLKKRDEKPRRPHGFASPRRPARAAKATLTTTNQPKTNAR